MNVIQQTIVKHADLTINSDILKWIVNVRLMAIRDIAHKSLEQTNIVKP